MANRKKLYVTDRDDLGESLGRLVGVGGGKIWEVEVAPHLRLIAVGGIDMEALRLLDAAIGHGIDRGPQTSIRTDGEVFGLMRQTFSQVLAALGGDTDG